LRELWHGEIHDNKKRREAKYSRNLEPAITEAQSQSNDRVSDLRETCGSIASNVQDLMVALHKVIKKC
jgi:hypothetical protein